MNRQEAKKRRFVDEDKIKTGKINEHVTKNYDHDYFYHLDDNYKAHQKVMSEQRKSLVELQRTIKNQNHQDELNQKRL